MRSTLERNEHLDAWADEHRRWLSQFDPQHRANWEKLLSSDYEAAVMEASVRRVLEHHGVRVEPNERLTGECGGPDFRCSIGGQRFYVEVTCISIATAARKSGIEVGRRKFSPFNVTGMIDAIFSECMNKAPQCANLDAPALVAIGTFHTSAAMSGLDKVLVNMALTGTTKMAWDINPKTGEQTDVYQLTELASAAFLRPDKAQEIGFARCSISGLLLVKPGSPDILGILYPNPARAFDSACLPAVEFGQVELDRQSRHLRTQWSKQTA